MAMETGECGESDFVLCQMAEDLHQDYQEEVTPPVGSPAVTAPARLEEVVEVTGDDGE